MLKRYENLNSFSPVKEIKEIDMGYIVMFDNLDREATFSKPRYEVIIKNNPVKNLCLGKFTKLSSSTMLVLLIEYKCGFWGILASSIKNVEWWKG
jgi:hypothetical protein